MSLDIHIRIRKPQVCTHCGTRMPGMVKDEVFLGGSCYYDLIRDIGYKDNHYGDYIGLSKTDAETVVRAMSANGSNEAGTVATAVIDGDFIEFEADW